MNFGLILVFFYEIDCKENSETSSGECKKVSSRFRASKNSCLLDALYVRCINERYNRHVCCIHVSIYFVNLFAFVCNCRRFSSVRNSVKWNKFECQTRGCYFPDFLSVVKGSFDFFFFSLKRRLKLNLWNENSINWK